MAGAFGAPPWLRLRPLTLSPSRIHYVADGRQTLSASIAAQGIELAVVIEPEETGLTVPRLSIRDGVSNATMGLRIKGSAFDLSFNGTLHQQTLDQLLTGDSVIAGSIDGSLRVLRDPRDRSAIGLLGRLRGRDIRIAYPGLALLNIDTVSLHGDGSAITIDSILLNMNDTALKVSGRIQPESSKQVRLDLDVAAAAVDLDRLLGAFDRAAGGKHAQRGQRSAIVSATGTIRFAVDRVTFGEVAWRPFNGAIDLKNGAIEVRLTDAVLCGISTPGSLSVSAAVVGFDIETVVDDGAVNSSLTCLAAAGLFGDNGDTTFKADGTYSLKGRFKGQGHPDELLSTTSGTASFSATDGRIYKDAVLLNVLKFLNATELLTGQFDLGKIEREGLRYRALNVEASLRDGKLTYDKAILDSTALALTGAGSQDLLTGRLDVNLLVTLQVTLGRVLNKVPLVGGFLNVFNTIPLGLKGTVQKVHIRPLAPSAVSYQLKTLMENTVRGPVKLMTIGRRPAADERMSPR
jgi:hypothetical protein